METKFDIQPYVGIGRLRFGMKKDEVANILGPPDKLGKSTISSEIKEFRYDNGLQTVYSDTDYRLIEVSLYSNIPNVKLNELDIFNRSGNEVIKCLIEADGNPLTTVGIIVFLNLGISMTGFQQEDEPGQKSISVFEKGRWDEDIEDLEPFSDS